LEVRVLREEFLRSKSAAEIRLSRSAAQQLVGDALWREAQDRLEHNLAVKRHAPQHFYLLGGMVRCAQCQKCYVGSTKHTCKAKQHTYYAHRKNNGHCRNHSIPGPYLEALVWDKIERMFLKLENLSQGYEESIAQQRAATARPQAHLETLRRGIIKLEQKRANLHAAYIDPEIGMTKVDYLTQKSQLDEENKALLRQVAEVEKELAETPTAESLADFEAFAREVQFGILEGELAPEEKRKVLETLHVKVMIGADDIRLEGWLGSEGQGVLSNASACIGRKPVKSDFVVHLTRPC
jgi:hypothetical protein